MSSPVLSSSETSETSDTIPDSWCITEFRERKNSFSWKIKNFHLCTVQNGKFLNSSTFTAYDELEWYIQLFPNGNEKDSEGHLSVFLCLRSAQEEPVMVHFNFYIYNKDMEKRNEKCSSVHRFLQGDDWGFSKFIRRECLLDKSKGLCPDLALNVGCDIYMVESPIVTSGAKDRALLPVECDLSQNLGELLRSEQCCDVILTVNGTKLNAHKAILAARSPVFLAMFRHEMQEKEKNEVLITDADKETMEELLWYIYTGKVNNLEKFASDLLALSDKYDLPGLKLMCEQCLISKLSVDTALDILLLADTYNAKRLKKGAITYLLLKPEAIVCMPKWDPISSQRPDLVKELFNACMTERVPAGSSLSTDIAVSKDEQNNSVNNESR